MKSNIRSKYIKDVLADRESLKATLEENTKESLKTILSESLNKEIRNLISEADDKDSYEEEEVNAPIASLDTEEKPEESAEVADAEVEAEPELDVEVSAEDNSDADLDAEDAEDAKDGEEDVWASLEKYKDEDGEYDLTGMDDESMVKVYKALGNDDNIRVVKKGENQVAVEVPASEEDVELIIDLDDEPKAAESEELNEENLNYTDNYQDKTAMTTLPNKEVASAKDTYSMDGGVPEGDSKPWVGKAGDMAPYSDKVNEEVDECGNEMVFEVVLDDEAPVEGGELEEGASFGKAQQHSTAKSKVRDTSCNGGAPEVTHDASVGSEFKSELEENFNRKFNAILEENKELKTILGELKKQLNEATVVNMSLSKILKLITENSTTQDEKVNIIKRFDNVKTLNEAKGLYNTINSELKKGTSSAKNSGVMQITEAKNVVETPLYKSNDAMNEAKSLISRIESLGR